MDPGLPLKRRFATRVGLLPAAAAAFFLASPAQAGVIATHPLDGSRTGFVDELGGRLADEMVSGSLQLVGYGADCRGYAEFDISSIPDDVTVTSAELIVWLSNHDNPGDPAVPLTLEVHGVASQASAPEPALHAAIGPLGAGRLYVRDVVLRTGVEFCPDAFVEKRYSLGPLAVADVQAALASDWVTVGVVSEIVTDPFFDHIDLIGYTEEVLNPICTTTAMPGSRITLRVGFDPPVAGDCDPRNHGFWHRWCLGIGAIDPGRNGGGNGPGPSPQHDDIPPSVLAAADAAMAAHGIGACVALDEGPFSDPRLAALRELATIHLNLAAGMLERSCPVELHPVDHRAGLTVADAMQGMEDRLVIGTVEALHEARWIGEHVNNGEALLER